MGLHSSNTQAQSVATSASDTPAQDAQDSQFLTGKSCLFIRRCRRACIARYVIPTSTRQSPNHHKCSSMARGEFLNCSSSARNCGSLRSAPSIPERSEIGQGLFLRAGQRYQLSRRPDTASAAFGLTAEGSSLCWKSEQVPPPLLECSSSVIPSAYPPVTDAPEKHR